MELQGSQGESTVAITMANATHTVLDVIEQYKTLTDQQREQIDKLNKEILKLKDEIDVLKPTEEKSG